MSFFSYFYTSTYDAKMSMINQLFDKLSIQAMIGYVSVIGSSDTSTGNFTAEKILETKLTYDDLRKDYTEGIYEFMENNQMVLKEYLNFVKCFPKSYFIGFEYELDEKYAENYEPKYLTKEELKKSKFSPFTFCNGKKYKYNFLGMNPEGEQVEIINKILNPWIEEYIQKKVFLKVGFVTPPPQN